MTSEVNATDEQLAHNLRQAHKLYPTGVSIVTVHDGERPIGLAVNSFTSLSYNPPSVLVCVNKESSTYPSLFRASHFGVNLLANDQLNIANTFASKSKDKFQGIDWSPAEHGSPILDGAAAFFEIQIDYRLPVYTHTILVGKIVGAGYDDSLAPLIFRGGKFFDGAELLPITE